MVHDDASISRASFKPELGSNFHLQSERNTKLTLKAAAKYCFDWQAGSVATVSIPARLNMSRASSQPATLRADIIPAGKDWLSIVDTIAARLHETAVALERAVAAPGLEIS
jgi:hypothetical protein